MTDNPSSLVVLAAHQRSKWAWFSRSKAEPIARIAAATSLFVPDGIDGFVSVETGEIYLHNILIPIALHPNCSDTVESVCQLIDCLGVASANLHFLYIGDEANLPAIPQLSSTRLDAVRGNSTEQVLRQIHCPLWAVTNR